LRKSHLAVMAAVVGVSLFFGNAANAILRGPSMTSIGQASQIRLGAQAAIPLGYYNLCRRGHPVCRTTGGTLAVNDNGAVQLTEARVAELTVVNRSVNQSMRPVHDMGGDRWTVGGSRGDCEDYAITKRDQLMRRGWPSGALLVALARIRGGQQHAVLVVRTTSGDFVLDNLRAGIKPWDRTGYRYDKIQSPTATWVWHRT
jgi:predicted transglutaminase-like cysteine proteinase